MRAECRAIGLESDCCGDYDEDVNVGTFARERENETSWQPAKKKEALRLVRHRREYLRWTRNMLIKLLREASAMSNLIQMPPISSKRIALYCCGLTAPLTRTSSIAGSTPRKERSACGTELVWIDLEGTRYKDSVAV